MNKSFETLDEPKREKILDAAFREFADFGYGKASTDRIAAEAGIGKGTLFFYFNSKKELYRDLIEIGMEVLQKKYVSGITDEGDYLERYQQASMVKLRAYHERPHMLEFLGRIYLEQDDALFSEEIKKKLNDMREKFLSAYIVDTGQTRFRADIPRERILTMIRWLMEGYERELMAVFRGRALTKIDIDPYWDEYTAFLALLKKIFYSEEAHAPCP